MTFVLDASVVLAWHFADERWQGAAALASLARREKVVAPSYLGLEVTNGLLRGERMERTSGEAIKLFLKAFGYLQVDRHDFGHDEIVSSLLPLARAQGLRVFDAGYLHLALVNGLPLATFDEKLVRAARALGLPSMENRL